ncbi:MAG: HTH domain-containing protein, partial [Clostridia bacterium]|nr:HTH domain-containing protein [Clostridia bacterium]
MKGEMRRESILARLGDSDIPVSASSLSQAFGVSRQIIVKDIARLREMGAPITSHARGYILEKKTRPERVLKIIHSDEDVEKELNLIVDLGGAVEDVFIYHKFYN